MERYGTLRSMEESMKKLGIHDRELQQEVQKVKVEVCRKTKLFLKQLRTIELAIEKIPDGTQALILRYRYVDCLGWERISEELSYSIRMLHQLHLKALENIIF